MFGELLRILEDKGLEDSVSINMSMDQMPMRDALKMYSYLDYGNGNHDFIYECLPVGLSTRSHYEHLQCSVCASHYHDFHILHQFL